MTPRLFGALHYVTIGAGAPRRLCLSADRESQLEVALVQHHCEEFATKLPSNLR
jgi:hypothetical protein